jgi:hypothetical protein
MASAQIFRFGAFGSEQLIGFAAISGVPAARVGAR